MILFFWRRSRLPTPVFLGFSCGSAGKESACNGGDLGLIPGLGRSPGEGNGTHSSILACRIPWTVQSMGWQRVRHCAAFTLTLTVLLREVGKRDRSEGGKPVTVVQVKDEGTQLAVVEVEEEVTFDLLCTCAFSMKLIVKTFQFKSTFQLLAMESRRLIIPTLLDQLLTHSFRHSQLKTVFECKFDFGNSS